VAELSELVGLIESGCAGVASRIAEMVGEQVVVEPVAATIEAQQRCEVWSRRVVVVPCRRLGTSAPYDRLWQKATAPPATRQPSWRRSDAG
jgi:hypothetical protein